MSTAYVLRAPPQRFSAPSTYRHDGQSRSSHYEEPVRQSSRSRVSKPLVGCATRPGRDRHTSSSHASTGASVRGLRSAALANGRDGLRRTSFTLERPTRTSQHATAARLNEPQAYHVGPSRAPREPTGSPDCSPGPSTSYSSHAARKDTTLIMTNDTRTLPAYDLSEQNDGEYVRDAQELGWSSSDTSESSSSSASDSSSSSSRSSSDYETDSEGEDALAAWVLHRRSPVRTSRRRRGEHQRGSRPSTRLSSPPPSSSTARHAVLRTPSGRRVPAVSSHPRSSSGIRIAPPTTTPLPSPLLPAATRNRKRASMREARRRTAGDLFPLDVDTEEERRCAMHEAHGRLAPTRWRELVSTPWSLQPTIEPESEHGDNIPGRAVTKERKRTGTMAQPLSLVQQKMKDAYRSTTLVDTELASLPATNCSCSVDSNASNGSTTSTTFSDASIFDSSSTAGLPSSVTTVATSCPSCSLPFSPSLASISSKQIFTLSSSASASARSKILTGSPVPTALCPLVEHILAVCTAEHEAGELSKLEREREEERAWQESCAKYAAAEQDRKLRRMAMAAIKNGNGAGSGWMKWMFADASYRSMRSVPQSATARTTVAASLGDALRGINGGSERKLDGKPIVSTQDPNKDAKGTIVPGKAQPITIAYGYRARCTQVQYLFPISSTISPRPSCSDADNDVDPENDELLGQEFVTFSIVHSHTTSPDPASAQTREFSSLARKTMRKRTARGRSSSPLPRSASYLACEFPPRSRSPSPEDDQDEEEEGASPRPRTLATRPPYTTKFSTPSRKRVSTDARFLRVYAMENALRSKAIDMHLGLDLQWSGSRAITMMRREKPGVWIFGGERGGVFNSRGQRLAEMRSSLRVVSE